MSLLTSLVSEYYKITKLSNAFTCAADNSTVSEYYKITKLSNISA